MITDLILNVLSLPIMFILDLIPDLPAFPSNITSFFDYLTSMVTTFSQLAVYIYGQGLYIAIVTLSIALIAFDQAYGLIMFTAKKLPLLNIK